MTTAPLMLRTIVPTMDLGDNLSPKNIIAQSPQEFRIVQYPATSFSQSNANWNIIPPSPQSIISRYVRVTMSLTFSIQGTLKPGNQKAYVINTNFCGLCQYPLHQIISTLTITLNNQAVTIRPSQIIDKLFHYSFDREAQKSTMSSTACYPDQSNSYDVETGSVTGEFVEYRDSVDHISRNCLPIVFTSNPQLTTNPPNTTGTANFTVLICEPLMISPLVFDPDWWRRPGLTQITNFSVNMTFDPVGLARVWRQATDDYVTYNSVSVTIGQPSLALAYYTLPTYMSIPPSISYPYTAVQNYVYNSSNPIAPAGQYTLTSTSIQFQSIPHRIYVGVSKAVNTRTLNDTDSFLPITNINITWGNISGVLSTLSQYDLWLISQKNGLKQSWAMFSGVELRAYGLALDTGNPFLQSIYGPSAPICLEFGSDIQLLNEDYPGKQGTWNFQIQVQGTNNQSSAVLPQLDIIVLYHGWMTIAGQSVTLNTGLTAPGTSIPDLLKTTFPRETDFYSGGKFDLGSILSSIPGRIVKGLSGLVSGLLGSEDKDEHPVIKYARRAARKVPAIVKQITEEPEEMEE
jgi:hypothetical protein